MLKNATLYRLTGAPARPIVLADVAGSAAFAPTGPTQPKSVGWVPPREKHGLLAESVAGQIIMAAMIETRAVPASALDKHVDHLAAGIELNTGRKPGKKQRRELKEQARLELLPQAFPKAVRVLVWIDPAAGLVVLDTASAGQADDVVTLMVQSMGLTLAPVQTKAPAGHIMSAWLHAGETDGGFALGRECELRAHGDSKATVRYSDSDIDTDDVKAHLTTGKSTTKLGLYWLDRVDCVLTDSMVLRKIAVNSLPPEGTADAFDADVAILTGELAPMLSDLIAVLGGEVIPEAEPEAAAS